MARRLAAEGVRCEPYQAKLSRWPPAAARLPAGVKPMRERDSGGETFRKGHPL